MKKEYKLVTWHSDALVLALAGLSEEVNININKGFSPIGGVSVVVVGDLVIATQAMLAE